MLKVEKGEKVMKVIRRHWLVMVPTFILLLILAYAPLIFYRLILSNMIPIDPEIFSKISILVEQWAGFAYSIWLIILWIFFFIEWTDYYLDLWIITDKKIVDVEQKGFFNREITSFRYEQIQDITVETKGLIRTIFNFGTLHIETAGREREIAIRDAARPEVAKSLIFSIQKENRENYHN